MGLRERKKEQTRQAIAAAAVRLFVERGFDRVPVADVARAADVSEKTVFNYFPTKEELVYNRLETFEEELLTAVRERRPGESVVAAFGRFVSRPRGLLAEPEGGEQLRAVTAMIAASPALRARERQIFERYTESLAKLLTADTGAREGDAEPWVVANALIGAHRALLEYVRRSLAAGRSNRSIAAAGRVEVGQAIARLEGGLGGYGVPGEP